MKRIGAGLVLAGLAGLTGWAGSAQAQATRMMMPEGTYDMVFGVGLQRTFFSESEGGARSVLAPALEVQWSNGVFIDVGTGEATLGMHLSEDPMLNIGVHVSASGRDQRADTPGQRGGVALQAGGYVNWNAANNISFGGALMGGGGIDGAGLIAHLRATVYHRLVPHHGARFEAGLALADSTWQQGYFGVSAEQAANGGSREYRAGAGLINFYGDVQWSWQLANKYSLITGARLSRLAAIPAASPLTGNRERVSLRTTLTYRF